MKENEIISNPHTLNTYVSYKVWFGLLMVLSATFNNVSAISWRSVVMETGVPGENVPYCRKSLTNFITSTSHHELGSNLQR